jgi:hypothetical protein
MGTYTDLLKLTPKKLSPLSPMGEVVFGQPAPSEAEPSKPDETTAIPQIVPLSTAPTSPASLPDSQKARHLANQKTRLPENKIARNLESQKTRKQENKISGLPESQKTDLKEFLSSMMESKALTKTSYRYPQALLDKLADVEYALRRAKGKKIHMNTILVFALAYLLWEYDERGEDSLLVTLT